MHDEKRFTVAGNASPLAGVVGQALLQTGGWSVPAIREPGFRMLETSLANLAAQEGFRALAPLPDNSQRIIDTAVIEVGMERLTFAADILAMGLTYNITDPLSVTQLEWNSMNRVGSAQRTMSPSARGENQLPNMLPFRLPIYLTTDDFQLDIRTLRMSQRVGLPLDTALIKMATRNVNEAIEDAAINGATTIDGQALQVAGYTAPGLLNAPNAETKVLTAAAWDVTPVPATIVAEIQTMMAQLRANKKYGPYHLYVNTEVAAVFDNDYVTASPQNTIRERLLKLEGLRAIRSADMIPAGAVGTLIGSKVALVQMTSDVIDMVVGQRPTVIPWTSLDGFTFHNLVMAIMIPRVRSDYNGESGICIGTLT